MISLAKISKRVTSRTFRHSFVTHLLEDGYEIRTVQELLGHEDVSITMIYTHVLRKGGMTVQGPLDKIRSLSITDRWTHDSFQYKNDMPAAAKRVRAKTCRFPAWMVLLGP